MKYGKTKSACGLNQAHSRRRYNQEGVREVVAQLEDGKVSYGWHNGGGRHGVDMSDVGASFCGGGPKARIRFCGENRETSMVPAKMCLPEDFS